jgi:hypothetical protein
VLIAADGDAGAGVSVEVGTGVGVTVGAGVDAVDGAGVDAAGAEGATDEIGAEGMVAAGASCGGTVIGAACCRTGAGAGLGAEATGGAATVPWPGQALPVLPPQTGVNDAIATTISSGCAAEREVAAVRPSRTAHRVASICCFRMRFSIIYLPLP